MYLSLKGIKGFLHDIIQEPKRRNTAKISTKGHLRYESSGNNCRLFFLKLVNFHQRHIVGELSTTTQQLNNQPTNPTQPNPTQPNPTQPNPTQPNPTQPNPTNQGIQFFPKEFNQPQVGLPWLIDGFVAGSAEGLLDHFDSGAGPSERGTFLGWAKEKTTG